MSQAAAADRPAPPEGAPASTAAKAGTLDSAAIRQEMKRLESSPEGLSTDEAQSRLAKYGPNAIKAREESRWRKLLRYFWGPIPWMIEAAALISVVMQDWIDFLVIGGLLLYNAAVGFWQDNRAASALEALRKDVALKARVRRDGDWTTIDATGLVPGDVVEIQGGDVLAADLLLIDGEYLSVDQSALTGESLPVSRKVGDSGYSGSVAKQGEMTGLVTATGNSTFFGRTAKLVARAGAKSHAEQAVLTIGDFLIILAAVLAAVLVGVQVWQDIVVSGTWSWAAAGSIAQFVLVLLVASVPVAMPAVMSVTMALGALALSKQKAIVSRLSSIEELAGVDVLCSDKTGTLTMNELTMQEPVTFGKAGRDEVVLAAALASKRQSEDPIDQAVFRGLKDPAKLDKFTSVDFVPFDPVKKKTVGIVTGPDGGKLQFSKGAPQVIAGLCGLDEDTAHDYGAKVQELADHGTRALGVARSRDDGQSWELLGILPLLDPPRPDAKQTIEQAEKLGLSVKMVTGDDVAIGSEISRQLGLGDHLLAASDVFPKDISTRNIPSDAAQAVERADGFARVFPEHKFEIVKALQERGHIVAMTGDGVNDAPALKQADCGMAVSGSTAAARSSAALILTAPGLSTIVNALVLSRQIFERITSYVYYRIAMTIDIMFVVVLANLVFGFHPLTAIMIVALALLDDIPIMTIAYDHVRAPRQPVRWDMHHIIVFSSIMGLTALVQSFGLVLICMFWMQNSDLMSFMPMDFLHLRTMLFLQLAAGGHLLLFVVRTRGTVLAPPYPSPPLFLAVIGTQILAVLMCAFGFLVPALPWTMIGLVWAYVLVWMVLMDLTKLGYFWLANRRAMEPSIIHELLSAALPSSK